MCKMPRMCAQSQCCQAITQRGMQCQRAATVSIDLMKQRSIFGYKLPRVNCCFFCSQHAAMLTGIAIQKISQTAAEYMYDWNDYIVLHPEYLAKTAKDFKIAT